MPFLLFKPRGYARSAGRKALSSYLIKTSKVSIHALSLALLSGGNPHSTHSLQSFPVQQLFSRWGYRPRMFWVCGVGSYRLTRSEFHKSPRKKIPHTGSLKSSCGPATEGKLSWSYRLDEEKQDWLVALQGMLIVISQSGCKMQKSLLGFLMNYQGQNLI